jgi:redox-sensing transcriptional repressor
MSENIKKVPAVVIRRLPRYYRYLGELMKQGITRISSNALSQKMHVTASQIRQDFNYFGGFGQQGYGYNVETLHKEIGDILGLNDGDTMIIVGAGNLGHALANHNNFEKRGFRLVGIFDNNPDIIGTSINGVEVMGSDNMEDFIKNNRVDIAILTLPKAAVQKTAERLVNAGVKGFMNFSYMELKAPGNIAVSNVHLSDPLMFLSYEIKKGREE